MISRALSIKASVNIPIRRSKKYSNSKQSGKTSSRHSGGITLEELAALDSEFHSSSGSEDDNSNSDIDDDDSEYEVIRAKPKRSGNKKEVKTDNSDSENDSPENENNVKENDIIQKYEIKMKSIDERVHSKISKIKCIFNTFDKKSKSFCIKADRHLSGLIETLSETFNSVASCLESQKKAYIERLKSSQEVNNAATRNLVQTTKVQ